MIGIESIGYYICENKESNLGKEFNGQKLDDNFVKNKVGIESFVIKNSNDNISDLCVKAYYDLTSKLPDFNVNDTDCICLCGQAGDYISSHTSTVIQYASMPIVLSKYMNNNLKNIYLAAIGDGLSIACMPITMV